MNARKTDYWCLSEILRETPPLLSYHRGLAVQVREKLQKLDGYFLKLADAMEAWIDAWEQLNPAEAPAALSESKAPPAQHALANGKA